MIRLILFTESGAWSTFTALQWSWWQRKKMKLQSDILSPSVSSQMHC